MSDATDRRFIIAVVGAAVGVYAAVVGFRLVPADDYQLDLWIYRWGVGETWAGRSPYEFPALGAALDEYLPGRALPAGYFLCPTAALALGPFSAAGWEGGRLLYLALQPALAGVAVLGVRSVAGPGRLAAAGWAAVFVVFLLNPITLRVVAMGQLGLLVTAGLAAGLALVHAGRPVAGAVCLAAGSVKPQLAVPFYLFAFAAYGVRPGLVAAAVGAAAVVLGTLPTGGPLATLPGYVRHLAGGYERVHFNRVQNEAMVGLNRLVLAAGGPAVDLTAPAVVAGYLAWAVAVRVRIGRPDRAADPVLLAAAGVAPLAFAQCHLYEMLLLVFWVPYLLDLRRRRVRSVAIVLGLLAVAAVPRGGVEAAVDRLGLAGPAADLALAYRAAVVAGLSGYLLVVGKGPAAEPA